jgi:hypothetical protein
VEGAINAGADIPGFIRQFNAPFPVGTADNMAALNYMELSPMVRSFVPFMLFIDRQGMIRAQFTGNDPPDFFLADKMEQNIREQALKLLSEPAAAVKPKKKKAG